MREFTEAEKQQLQSKIRDQQERRLRACLKKKKVVRTVDVYVYSLEQLILNQ